MSSAIIVSADPIAASKLEQALLKSSLRARVVTSAQLAREWFTMETQPLAALFVDARFSAKTVLELCTLAWTKSPLTMGFAFQFSDPIDNEWLMRGGGVRIIKDEADIQLSAEALKKIPNENATHGHFGILVVEDLDSPRDIICSYIESLGYQQVEGASRANEAFQTLQKRRGYFDCVITDLNMPERDGIQLIRDIRRDPELNLLPVIVLTAYPTAGNLVEAIEAGASGFLVKPPGRTALARELERARRTRFSRSNPRLCRPEDAHLLEQALQQLALG